VKYDRIEAMRQDYPIAVLCRVFEIGASSYYAWRGRAQSALAQENARLEVQIAAVHERIRQTYGNDCRQMAFTKSGAVAPNWDFVASRNASFGIRRIRARFAHRTECAGAQF
jgi:hypothetical protein